MAGPGASTGTASAAEALRERGFRLALLGLVVLVLGFTATLMANFFYPCEPAAGSVVQPPLAECAAFLSPWLAVALAGLILAAVAYRRVG